MEVIEALTPKTSHLCAVCVECEMKTTIVRQSAGYVFAAVHYS
jgi:hypothetical protein